jgi:hypothetical protein
MGFLPEDQKIYFTLYLIFYGLTSINLRVDNFRQIFSGVQWVLFKTNIKLISNSHHLYTHTYIIHIYVIHLFLYPGSLLPFFIFLSKLDVSNSIFNVLDEIISWISLRQIIVQFIILSLVKFYVISIFNHFCFQVLSFWCEEILLFANILHIVIMLLFSSIQVLGFLLLLFVGWLVGWVFFYLS